MSHTRTLTCGMCKETFATDTTDEQAAELGLQHPLGIDSATGSRDGWVVVCDRCAVLLSALAAARGYNKTGRPPL